MNMRVTDQFMSTYSLDVPRSDIALSGGRYSANWKRRLDVFLVCLTLPIWGPFLLIAAGMAMLDGGPAFYTQPRVGRSGKTFLMYKLRSMRVDAERHLTEILLQDPQAAVEWQHRQKLRKDPRITFIGKMLRKTSLDELPQLWNVLRGDMSLVGPRPMLPEQSAMYPGTAYFRMRPGLTGPWQVFGRNEESFGARAKYDAMYERKLGAFYDLSLIGRTFGVVLWGTGH